MSVRAQSRTLIYFLLLSSIGFSQKKAIKKFTTENNKIIIDTEGLDDFVLENSNSNFVEVILYAENPNKQHILIDTKTYETSIQFKLPIPLEKEIIFRKFITERLKRAKATIKIPANKEVTILGENINVASKSYHGNLRIFLENGIVKLDTVQQNVELKLFSGNVFATTKKTNFNIVSNLGKISVDAILYQKEYKKTVSDTSKELAITSIRGNIFINLI